MVDLFKALLPLPQSTSERSIRWHIEISHSLQPRNLDLMDPPTDIEIERLVLQVKKIPWAKLPQTHTIYVSLIEDVDYLLSAIDPPLNELRIGSQVQKLSKMQPLANITSLLSLTTLYSAAWFALRVLQSRSVPSLKRLTLLIYNSDPKANVAPLTPTARAEGRQEVDCVLEELGEYKEVSLEMIQFPSSPTWVTLCNLINTRYSEPGLQLALKLCELPCPVILRSLAAAFRGEYSFTQDPICQDHENETVVAPGDGGGEMPVHLTKDNLINYGYSGYPATYI
ncbi:hypothetical protein FRC17_007518 [Serendipita sp. 399]|nr:hypothetical protein FRC17_007518 [Serendipita sp. 399]